MKSLDQAIFDQIIIIGTDLGYDTYPSLPMDEVPYPFINMVSNQELPQVNKSNVKSKFAVRLTIWGNFYQRKDISAMSANLQKHLQSFKLENGWNITMKRGTFKPNLYQEVISPTSILWRSDITFELQLL